MRIESESKEQEEKKLKKELKKELGPRKVVVKKRSCFGCGGCFLIILIIILSLLLLAGAAAAKSGLAKIPVFTPFLYKEPKPIRFIKVREETEKNIEEILNQKIEKQLQKKITPEKIGKQIPFQFILTEEELTAFLRQGMKSLNEKNSRLYVKSAQLAITPDELELFTELRLSTRKVKPILILRFYPQMQDGRLELTLTKISLGNLNIPKSIGNIFIKGFLENWLNNFSQMASQFGDIKSIELKDGNLVVGAEVLVRKIKTY